MRDFVFAWIHAVLDVFASWTWQDWTVNLVGAGGLGILLGWAKVRWNRITP
jgi:hypothetical protein